MSFWDIIWFIIISYVFVAWLMVLFTIISDVFRDRDLSGLAKAAWVLALVFVPFLTALVYLAMRGPGMAQRQNRVLEQARAQQEDYIRSVATTNGAAADIAQAKSLMDAGTINQAEFDAIKQKALA
ncbi:SHOCT domain-containing protein [Nocardioides sp. zg-1308]|uniref:SHOCT domain-containing protein n=1 Tax=Nocardioides renjunii TaxID=3095075 RepID=A0ABU5K9V2_9ACTN|nr:MULTISPECIES: SHOCT domain-containing protein [unclassified Nocardioides]MDZ5661752.1 SHOCT domain-containing protein [Nocardioides sp. S-58]NPD06548.1 SHOCT domain-containing protein [Nocardioides sp. zg-1308]WQQ23993.1 SHOCT domain-containing protein [Nocardioides sp. S-34]